MQDSVEQPEPDAWRLYDDARALQAEGLYERAAERFGEAFVLADRLDHPQQQLLSMSARSARASALEQVGRLGEALAAHREIIERYGRVTGKRQRWLLARSMGVQAQIFIKLERWPEAAASVERLRAVFGSAPETDIQEIVRVARRMRTRPPSRWRHARQLLPGELLARWATRD